jgi:drug/metabolite transporter (DMT)-like permease
MAMGGVARVSQVQLLQTFVTLALSALVNGEHIEPITIGAAVAVVGIVALGRKARIEPHGPTGVLPESRGPED